MADEDSEAFLDVAVHKDVGESLTDGLRHLTGQGAGRVRGGRWQSLWTGCEPGQAAAAEVRTRHDERVDPDDRRSRCDRGGLVGGEDRIDVTAPVGIGAHSAGEL